MHWTDGSKYIGEWIRGIQHGYGTMSFPDGNKKEGFFDNNVFKGITVKSIRSSQESLPSGRSKF
jgi:hypothetical protein